MRPPPLEIKAGDNGHEVLIRVSPQTPVKIVSTLEDLKLNEITVNWIELAQKMAQAARAGVAIERKRVAGNACS